MRILRGRAGRAGEPAAIDFEGLAYCDAEWHHSWIHMRIDDACPRLDPVESPADRLEFHRYAHVPSLIDGLSRSAGTDLPDRERLLGRADPTVTAARTVR